MGRWEKWGWLLLFVTYDIIIWNSKEIPAFVPECGQQRESFAPDGSVERICIHKMKRKWVKKMGFADLFKATENAALKQQTEILQKQNEDLHNQLSALKDMIPRETQDLLEIKKQIEQKTRELDELAEKKEAELHEQIKDLEKEVDKLKKIQIALQERTTASESKLKSLQKEVIETNETILLQSFGLYEPKYDFANSSQYKDRLSHIRTRQKSMIKLNTAVLGSEDWMVNDSYKRGKKLVSDTKKLLLRAFNTECDDVISKVKFNNVDAQIKRIRTACRIISRLGSAMDIHISDEYLDLKIQELHLAHEYRVKKQEEKEEQSRIRAEEREQKKLLEEIKEARKKLEKEKKHCQNELERMLKQDTSQMTPEEKAAFDAKKAELESQLGEIAKGIADVDYRAANQRAGYVYIISNIGSFGENIYKIGMTRRLNPMDRVDELGDASVPFRFDVHAMIFSEDAPALEAALHKAFDDRKLNMVNTRREFFHVTLDEIKEVVKQNFDKTVEFVDSAPAEQYRESLLMKKMKSQDCLCGGE